MGKVGALVALASNKHSEIGRKLSRHIAAAQPKFLRISDVHPEIVEAERQIYRAQMVHSGRKIPENLLETMLEGKLKKFYSEEVMEAQGFLYEEGATVAEWLEKEGVGLGEGGVLGFRMMKK